MICWSFFYFQTRSAPFFLTFSHVSYPSFISVFRVWTRKHSLPECSPKSVELLTWAGCSFCSVYGNSCPSSVVLSLSQGKNQRLDFNKMIFTLNVYCAIKMLLCIQNVSSGNFCTALSSDFFANLGWPGGSQDMGSSVFFLCWLVSKFIWLPRILSVGKKNK